MTRMVTEKALELLTQSVSDIVGSETQIADALLCAVHSGKQTDMAWARMSFDQLESGVRRKVHGRALALAESNTVH
ncbi:MAG: hypothetical protein HOL85_13640 [Rhodospirillaceae bacterium]|jgi:hypothetical protein|nr:hypothetical protein [Rhodospirillaceae bacterium]MBT6138253.1 hypothetical protein [Rhodospirillaceae bacterium]